MPSGKIIPNFSGSFDFILDSRKAEESAAISPAGRRRAGTKGELGVWSGICAQFRNPGRASQCDRPRSPYPQINDYFDSTVIVELHGPAFELYRSDDLLSDLVSHFRRQAAAAATPADAVYPGSRSSAILWWSDERGRSDRRADQGRRAQTAESDLRLELANLLIQQASPADAIGACSTRFSRSTTRDLRRHEPQLAITAAIAAGNRERARHAAERLFGLRLDTETQIQLSGQMNQLGLPDLAEALPWAAAAAPRRSG